MGGQVVILRIDGKQIDLSVFEAQKAMEQCERSVGFKGTTPTPELLLAVRDWAERRLRVGFTLTASWLLWWSVCEVCDRLRRKSERIAEVGHWLHVDGTALSDERLYGLAANLPRIKAQHKCNSGQFDPTDYQGVYHLILLATGDEEQARRAQADAAERYVESKMGAS